MFITKIFSRLPTSRKSVSVGLGTYPDMLLAKVPINMAVWGTSVNRDDFVYEESTLVHKELIPKKVSKRREPDLYRDRSGYNEKEEYALVLDCVKRCHEKVMGYIWWANPNFDELAQSISVSVFTKNIYQRYNPLYYGSYDGYMLRSVLNLMRDYRAWYYRQKRDLSLNKTYKNNNCELMDVIPAKGLDIFTKYERKFLYKAFKAKVTEMDKLGTGLPGFTYKGIFDIWINGQSMDAYLRSFEYEKPLLNAYVDELRSELREIAYYYDMVASN